MLETAAVPILMKAVDWLFGEGSKVLDERRKRREEESAGGVDPDAVKEYIEHSSLDTSSPVVNSKNEALKLLVSESLIRSAESEIEHLLSLIKIHQKNYQLAKEKHAMWGPALVPPIVSHELSEAEASLVEVTLKLEGELSKIYGRQLDLSLEVEKS